jgi:micrococcal nuclease
VADGQTIEVSIDGTTSIVRYIGISVPVSTGPVASGATIVQQATVANAGLVARQTVILERDVSDLDESGRSLRYVWVQNGGRLTLVNLTLVSLGLAQVATSPPDLRYDELLREAEREARDAQRGLWASGTPASGSASP